MSELGVLFFFLSLACILIAFLLLIIGVIINAISGNFTIVKAGLYGLLIGGILMLLSAAFCSFGGSQDNVNPRIDTTYSYPHVDEIQPHYDTTETYYDTIGQ